MTTILTLAAVYALGITLTADTVLHAVCRAPWHAEAVAAVITMAAAVRITLDTLGGAS